MDYQKIYYQLIESRKTRGIERENGYDLHHIIPKCFGGTNDKSNLVKLTPREHLIAHLLLYRIQTDKRKRFQMLTAVIMMKGKCENSRLYEKARKEFIETHRENISGKNHPMYGKSRKGIENPFYGKTHNEETRKRLSEYSKDKIMCKNIKTGQHLKVSIEEYKSNDDLVGITKNNKLSKEHREKISKNNAKVCQNKVATFDIYDKCFKQVPKDEYYKLRKKRYFGTNSKVAKNFKETGKIDKNLL